jgi:hypothetical protein
MSSMPVDRVPMDHITGIKRGAEGVPAEGGSSLAKRAKKAGEVPVGLFTLPSSILNFGISPFFKLDDFSNFKRACKLINCNTEKLPTKAELISFISQEVYDQLCRERKIACNYNLYEMRGASSEQQQNIFEAIQRFPASSFSRFLSPQKRVVDKLIVSLTNTDNFSLIQKFPDQYFPSIKRAYFESSTDVRRDLDIFQRVFPKMQNVETFSINMNLFNEIDIVGDLPKFEKLKTLEISNFNTANVRQRNLLLKLLQSNPNIESISFSDATLTHADPEPRRIANEFLESLFDLDLLKKVDELSLSSTIFSDENLLLFLNNCDLKKLDLQNIKSEFFTGSCFRDCGEQGDLISLNLDCTHISMVFLNDFFAKTKVLENIKVTLNQTWGELEVDFSNINNENLPLLKNLSFSDLIFTNPLNFSSFSTLENLEKLSLGWCTFPVIGAEVEFEGELGSLKKLVLNTNKYQGHGVLSKILAKTPNLVDLEIYIDNLYSEEAMPEISNDWIDLLLPFVLLKRLNIQNWNVAGIMKIINKCPAIEELSLENTALSKEVAALISPVILSNLKKIGVRFSGGLSEDAEFNPDDDDVEDDIIAFFAGLNISGYFDLIARANNLEKLDVDICEINEHIEFPWPDESLVLPTFHRLLSISVRDEIDEGEAFDPNCLFSLVSKSPNIKHLKVNSLPVDPSTLSQPLPAMLLDDALLAELAEAGAAAGLPAAVAAETAALLALPPGLEDDESEDDDVWGFLDGV